MKKENIINNISKEIEKPLFYYHEPKTYEELYNIIKKNPLKKPRIILYLFIVLLLIFIYTTLFKLIQAKLNINMINFIAIPLILIISFIIELILIKKSLHKEAIASNNELYFYQDHIIIKSKKHIVSFPYNKITSMSNSNKYISLTLNSNYGINKEKISKDFKDFLIELTKNYKLLVEKDNNIINKLEKNIDNYKFNYTNILNEDNLKETYNTNKTLLRYIIFSYILVAIVICILYFPLYINNQIEFSTSYLIIYIIIVPVVSLINKQRYINNCISRTLVGTANMTCPKCKKPVKLTDQFCEKCGNKLDVNPRSNQMYFYDTFLLSKSDTCIIIVEYEKLDLLKESDKYIILKVKRTNSIIVFEKDKLNKDNLKFINKIIYKN